MTAHTTDNIQESDPQIAWLAVFAAIFSVAIVGTALSLSIPLLSILMDQQNISASLIGLNTAMAGVASIAAALSVMRIAGSIGVLKTMFLAIGIMFLMLLCFYFITFFPLWFVFRFFFSFSITTIFILSEFWINSKAPSQKRGMILGIYATVLALGFALGPAILSLTGSKGFLPFLVTMVLVAIAILPIFLARHEAPKIERVSKENANFSKFLFFAPAALFAVLIYGAIQTGGFAMFPIYGADIGYTETQATRLLTIIGLGGVFLQIPLGLLSDRMKDRRHLLMLCALVGLIGMVLIDFTVSNYWLTALILFVWGGVIGGLYTVGLAHLSSRLHGNDLAAANSVFILYFSIGLLLGPYFVGVSMDYAGTFGFILSLGSFFACYILIAGVRVLTNK